MGFQITHSSVLKNFARDLDVYTVMSLYVFMYCTYNSDPYLVTCFCRTKRRKVEDFESLEDLETPTTVETNQEHIGIPN